MDINLDYVFKYRIGDICMHAALGHVKEIRIEKYEWASRRQPCRYLVVERLLQHCPGGVQKLYVARSVSSDGEIGSYVNMKEEELAPYPQMKEEQE